MENEVLIIERTFPVTSEKIWKAITDKEAMEKWYFDLQEFKPEPGFEFCFWGGPTEDRQYLHICTITEVITEKKLSYSWKYEGYEGITVVNFELFEEGNQTRLKLTHEGLDTFPANNPDFARKNFEEGWTWIIGTALNDFLS